MKRKNLRNEHFAKRLILKNMFVGYFGEARTGTGSPKKEKREQASRTPD
jgi:hypothetical protein